MSNEIAEIQQEVNEDIDIINNGGRLLVSSIEVAAHYKKRHENVMRQINTIISTNRKCESMFVVATYKNAQNHEYPCYYMDRNGFSILTMGFTGKEALEWKIKYINAFTAMERTIQMMKLDSYRIEDPVLRAQRWIEEHKQAVENEKKLKIAAPKAETFDQICTSQASMNFTEAAKVLGIKRSVLIDALEHHMYIYRNRNSVIVPYAQYSETGNGTFILRRIPYGEPYRNAKGEICRNTSLQTYITVAGMDRVRRLMKRWKIAC